MGLRCDLQGWLDRVSGTACILIQLLTRMARMNGKGGGAGRGVSMEWACRRSKCDGRVQNEGGEWSVSTEH